MDDTKGDDYKIYFMRFIPNTGCEFIGVFCAKNLYKFSTQNTPINGIKHIIKFTEDVEYKNINDNCTNNDENLDDCIKLSDGNFNNIQMENDIIIIGTLNDAIESWAFLLGEGELIYDENDKILSIILKNGTEFDTSGFKPEEIIYALKGKNQSEILKIRNKPEMNVIQKQDLSQEKNNPIEKAILTEEEKTNLVTSSSIELSSLPKKDLKPNLISDDALESIKTSLETKAANIDNAINLELLMNKLKGISSNLNSKTINKEVTQVTPDNVIELFSEVVNKILNDKIIYKLTSLDIDKFLDILNTTKILLNTTKIQNGTAAELVGIDDKMKNTLIKTIVDFLYIDLSNFQYGGTLGVNDQNKTLSDRQILGKLFHSLKNTETEAMNLTYENILSEPTFVKSKNNYGKLIYNNENNENNENNVIFNNKLILYINDFVKSVNTSYSYYSDKEWNGWKNNYYNLILERINSHLPFIENILLTINILNYEKNTDLDAYLKIAIQENTDKNIITFLKLRNNEQNFDIINERNYNRRFQIYINIPGPNKEKLVSNKLILRYNAHNFPFYEITTEPNKSTLYDANKQLLKYNETGKYFKKSNQTENISVLEYDSTYVFGEFSRLFTPELNNKEISDKMDVIQNKLTGDDNNPPSPVFMLGYGASGAGKTSSLIYFNKGEGDNRDGILIHLCNILGATGNYPLIKIKCKEFYVTDESQRAIGKSVDPKDPSSYDLSKPRMVNIPDRDLTCIETIDFKWENSRYKLTKPYEHPNHHQYRTLAKRLVSKKQIDDIQNNSILSEEEKKRQIDALRKNNDFEFSKEFKAGASIGELLIHLIDTDRFVKATTNNPNSSRSHCLVFVEFIHNDTSEEINKNANIIIGDFAGVENTFACENSKVINDFLSVARDDDFKESYYGTEKIGTQLDPYGPNTFSENKDVKGNIAEMQEKCNNSGDNIMHGGKVVKIETDVSENTDVTDPLYDFEKPVFRANFDTNLKKFFGVETKLDNGKNTVKSIAKPDMFTLYMKFIYKYTGLEGVSNVDDQGDDLQSKYENLLSNFKKLPKFFNYVQNPSSRRTQIIGYLKNFYQGIIIDTELDIKIQTTTGSLTTIAEENRKNTEKNDNINKILNEFDKLYDGIKDKDWSEITKTFDTSKLTLDDVFNNNSNNLDKDAVKKRKIELIMGEFIKNYPASYEYNNNIDEITLDEIKKKKNVVISTNEKYNGKPKYTDVPTTYEKNTRNKTLSNLIFQEEDIKTKFDEMIKDDANKSKFFNFYWSSTDFTMLNPKTYWDGKARTEKVKNFINKIILFEDKIKTEEINIEENIEIAKNKKFLEILIEKLNEMKPYVENNKKIVIDRTIEYIEKNITYMDANLDKKKEIKNMLKSVEYETKNINTIKTNIELLNETKIKFNKFVDDFITNNISSTQSVNLVTTQSTSSGVYTDPVTVTIADLIDKMYNEFGIDQNLLDSFGVDIKLEPPINNIFDIIYASSTTINGKTIPLFITPNMASINDIKLLENGEILQILFNILIAMKKEYNERTGNAGEICDHRRTEGYFINDSLKQVRSAIKEILFEKNKDSINIAPNFIDICFPSYCPKKEDCFSFEPDTKKSNSVIINTIFEEIKAKELSKEGTNRDELKKQFFKDLIVSVFCVFNISRAANNPPPTPYIDINELKLLFNNSDIHDLYTDKLIVFQEKTQEIIDMIEQGPYEKTDEDIPDSEKKPINKHGFNNRVDGLRQIPTIYNGISNREYKLNNTDGADTIITKMKKLNEHFKNYASIADENEKEYYEEKNYLYTNVIKEFIDMIDKNNAISAVGTLEFLDQLAKFNTITNVCRNNDNYLVPETINNYIERAGLFELYGNKYKTRFNEIYGKKYSDSYRNIIGPSIKNKKKIGGNKKRAYTKKHYRNLKK